MNKKNWKLMTVDEFMNELRENNLTRAQYAILNSVKYGVNSLKYVCAHAAWIGEVNELLRSTQEECDGALQELLALGYLQIVTKDILREIELALISEPSLGPTSGLPREGSVDFTLTGIALFTPIAEKAFRWRASELYSKKIETVGDLYKITITATTKAKAKQILENQLDIFQNAQVRYGEKPVPKLLAASNPIRIGLWRDHWWRKPMRAWLLKAIFVGEAKQAE